MAKLNILTNLHSVVLVGAFNGFLKAKLQINEVIVAIMLNYVCKFLTSHYVNGPLKEEGSQTAKTVAIGEEYMLSKLVPTLSPCRHLVPI
mgnify:CR=1 FL=1